MAGIGGPGGSFGPTAASRHYTSGMVAFDTTDLLALEANPQTRSEVQQIVLHELGHLVGLDHIDDRSEVMFPTASTAITGYANGDLRGLHALGSGTCSAQ
jgi:predicted Zn-dependent protease